LQLLTFTVAGQTYAIESRRVIEVLPLVPARPIPHMPGFIRGIFTYRGRLVPLVDLALLLAVGQLQERLSTRVIVVEYAAAGRASQQLGLVAENVISVCSAEDAEAGHALQAGVWLAARAAEQWERDKANAAVAEKEEKVRQMKVARQIAAEKAAAMATLAIDALLPHEVRVCVCVST
jgi:chemotaxis signal transduction protein